MTKSDARVDMITFVAVVGQMKLPVAICHGVDYLPAETASNNCLHSLF